MPVAFPSKSFSDWLTKNCTPDEQRSVTAMIRDLNRYGLNLSDPELTKLTRGHAIGGSLGLRINVYVMPERISISLGSIRKTWFGIVEVAASGGSLGQVLVGRLLVLKAWTTDPNVMGLRAAEQDLIAQAQIEYP